MLWPTSRTGVRRQAKRETGMISYNILAAWHSGDGVILLVSLWSHDAHLSETLISGMQHMPNSVVCLSPVLRCNSRGSCHLPLYFEFQSCDLCIGFKLHTWFWRTVVLGGLQSRGEPIEGAGQKCHWIRWNCSVCLYSDAQAASGLQHWRWHITLIDMVGRLPVLRSYQKMLKEIRDYSQSTHPQNCREMTHKNNNHQFGIPHLNFTLVSFIKKIIKKQFLQLHNSALHGTFHLCNIMYLLYKSQWYSEW